MPAASIELNRFIISAPAETSSNSRPSFWARAFKAMQEAQLRRAEAHVARLIEARGSRFTDSLEREIEHRIG